MHRAMMHGATTGLAGVFRQFALFAPGDELGLTIRAAHVAGGAECDDAFVTSSRGDGGGFERDGVAFAACHRAGGAVACGLGGSGLTGDESQGADGHESCDDGFDEFRFHDVVVLMVDEASASTTTNPAALANPCGAQGGRTACQCRVSQPVNRRALHATSGGHGRCVFPRL